MLFLIADVVACFNCELTIFPTTGKDDIIDPVRVVFHGVYKSDLTFPDTPCSDDTITSCRMYPRQIAQV